MLFVYEMKKHTDYNQNHRKKINLLNTSNPSE